MKAFVVSMSAACVLLYSPFATAKCSIFKHADIAVTMNGTRPIVPVQINGQPAHFLLDSGAFFSMMSPATAAQFKLKTTNTPFGMRIMGVGGSSATEVTVVKELKFAQGAATNVEFGVAGGEVGVADGLLGQNLLSTFDIEYDFEHGAVRLFRTEGCDDARLSYWLPVDQKPSVLQIPGVEERDTRTLGTVYINGQKLKVQFDTGASSSVLTLEGAAKAGIKPQSPGVVDGGYSHGVGKSMIKTYIATFNSFAIGDSEEIKNARLRFADFHLNGIDMLVGADFFIAHRVFVASKERKIFLSYNGGPVFNVATNPSSEKNVEGAGPPPATSASTAALAETSAEEAARKGSALDARREFAAALAYLSRAVELSPNDPEYYFQRGNAYMDSGQREAALKDFSQATKLKADYLPPYLPLARLHIDKGDSPAAVADLEAADRLAAPQANLRYELGALFAELDRYPQSIEQFSKWIDVHESDSRYAGALAYRCYDRAMQNEALPAALGDCSAALRRAAKPEPAYAAALNDRAIVRLRMGELDKATDDNGEALKLSPKDADSLYIRGVIEARKGRRADSDKDIAAAKEAAPKVADHYAKTGISP